MRGVGCGAGCGDRVWGWRRRQGRGVWVTQVTTGRLGRVLGNPGSRCGWARLGGVGKGPPVPRSCRGARARPAAGSQGSVSPAPASRGPAEWTRWHGRSEGKGARGGRGGGGLQGLPWERSPDPHPDPRHGPALPGAAPCPPRARHRPGLARSGGPRWDWEHWGEWGGLGVLGGLGRADWSTLGCYWEHWGDWRGLGAPERSRSKRPWCCWELGLGGLGTLGGLGRADWSTLGCYWEHWGGLGALGKSSSECPQCCWELGLGALGGSCHQYEVWRLCWGCWCRGWFRGGGEKPLGTRAVQDADPAGVSPVSLASSAEGTARGADACGDRVGRPPCSRSGTGEPLAWSISPPRRS